MKRLFLAFLLILALPSWAWAANMTIYMSAAGTAESPYNSWATGATTPEQVRAVPLDAGTHTIHLRPGDTFTGHFDSDNWTAGGTITIKATDGDDKSVAVDGNPSIISDGGGNTTRPTGSTIYGSHIIVGKAVNITIQGIDIKGQDAFPGSKVYAVRLSDTVNTTVTDCTFDGQLGTTIDSPTHSYNGALILTYTTGTVSITGNTIQYWGPPCLWATPEIPAGGTAYESVDASGIALVGIKNAAASVSISGNTIANVNGDGVVEENCTVPITVTNTLIKNAGENAVDIKGTAVNHVYANWFYRDATFTGMGGYPVASNVRKNGLVQFLYKDPNQAQNNLIEENYLGPTDTSAFSYKGNISNNTVRYNSIIDAKTGNYFYGPTEASTGASVGNASYSNRYIGTDGNFVYSEGYRGEFTFENETFYSDEDMGVGLYLLWFDGTFRNCAFRMNDSDSEMANIDANSAPTFSYNIWHNADAGDDNVIVWAGHTTRTESAADLILWNAEAISGNDIFGDPGLGADGYATGSGSAVVNAGTTPTYALSGLGSTSIWTYGSVDVDPVNRADNGGADIGAGEFPEDVPPPPVGGAAPTGTYSRAWNGDYTDDTDKAWITNGTDQIDGTIAAGVEIAGAHGVSGNGARFNVVDESIKWTTDFTPDEITIWLTITPESLNSGNTNFLHIYQDGSNQIYVYFRSTGVITVRHEGQGTVVTMTTAATLSALTTTTVGIRVTVAGNALGVKVGAADWEADADETVVTAFAAGTPYVAIGETTDSAAVGLANPYTVDNFSLAEVYNQAAPDWTGADVTAPTITARGVCSDAYCTACTADLTAAYVLDDSFRICAAVDEDVIVNEPPDWTFVCGTVTISLSYFQKVDIAGTKYLTALATIPAKARCTDPELVEMTNYTGVVDGSANALDPTGSAGAFSTGTITIGSAGSWSIGTFTDDESNEYQGEYATLTDAIAAIGQPIDDDAISIGTSTEAAQVTLTGGTTGHPVVITGQGADTTTLTVPNGIKIGSGAFVTFRDLTIDGGLSGGKTQRCKLTP